MACLQLSNAFGQMLHDPFFASMIVNVDLHKLVCLLLQEMIVLRIALAGIDSRWLLDRPSLLLLCREVLIHVVIIAVVHFQTFSE